MGIPKYKDSTAKSIYRENNEKYNVSSRDCLKCQKKFKPQAKFNRICKACTDSNDHYRYSAYHNDMNV